MIDSADGTIARTATVSLRSIGFYASAVVTALFMVRVLGASWSTHFPAVWPDAVFPEQGYLAVAGKSPFRPSFYFAFRPIGYPTLLWLCGRSTQITVVAQTALYCAGVIALGATALRVMHSRVVAVATTVAIVGIAVQAKYALWNTQILSEALAISLGFATISAWWRFAATPTPGRARWGWTFLIAFVLVRDAHVLATTIVIVPVAVAVGCLAKSLNRRVRRSLIVGAVLVMIVAGYSYFAQSASHRAELSVHNLVGMRLLPDAELREWFKSHGMPVDHALLTRKGKSGLEDDFYLTKDPAFAKYRHWARSEGPRAIALSLIALAPHYSHLFSDDLPTMLAGDVRFYDAQDVYRRLPRQMPWQLGGPVSRTGLAIWLVLGGAALVATLTLALWRKRGLGLVLFGATALIVTLAELYATWAADPVELERHVIGALSRLSLILVIVIASAIDAAITATRAGRDG